MVSEREGSGRRSEIPPHCRHNRPAPSEAHPPPHHHHHIPRSANRAPHPSAVAVFDPLDGSSNVDANIPTGTIFGIFEVPDSCEMEMDADGNISDEVRLGPWAGLGWGVVGARVDVSSPLPRPASRASRLVLL